MTFPDLLHFKLLPWSQSPSCIIGRPTQDRADLPPGVRLTRRKIRGKRVVVKNRRYYSNTRGLSALWPEAGLNEVNKLKLACVLSGHIDFQLGDYRLQCGPGHFIFIPAGMPHSDGSHPYVDAQASESCEIVFFLLHPNALQCWVSRSQIGQGREQIGNYLVLHERAAELFRILMEESLSPEPGSLSISTRLLPIFLSLVEREFTADRIQSVPGLSAPIPGDELARDIEGSDFATRLNNYLQANLHQPLTIATVSREMFLSPAQFTRTVRRETGRSFHELLADLRVKESKQLLKSTQWTASAIAAFVGFKSPNYFRTFFLRQTGMTPGEFRRGQD